MFLKMRVCIHFKSKKKGLELKFSLPWSPKNSELALCLGAPNGLLFRLGHTINFQGHITVLKLAEALKITDCITQNKITIYTACLLNSFNGLLQDNKVEQVVFIDWQIVRFASPLADVCYMLCMSTDQQLLESHLHQLLDIYYEALGLRMKDMCCDIEKSFPKEVFLEHFRNYMPFGLAMATGGLPIALSEPGDAKPIGDYEIEDGVVAINDVPLGEVPFQRISGLVDYFVKHDLM